MSQFLKMFIVCASVKCYVIYVCLYSMLITGITFEESVSFVYDFGIITEDFRYFGRSEFIGVIAICEVERCFMALVLER